MQETPAQRQSSPLDPAVAPAMVATQAGVLALVSPLSAALRRPGVQAALIAVAGLALWASLADPWTVTSDGLLYLAMADGGAAHAPFGFRVLSPALAGLLPLPSHLAFRVLGSMALVGSAVALLVWSREAASALTPRARPVAIVAVLLFVGSYPFVYQATAHASVDPITQLLLVSTLAAGSRRAPVWVLAALLTLAVLSHEMALILLPILVLDRALLAGMLGRRMLRWTELAGMGAVAVGALALVRAAVEAPSDPAQLSYLTPLAIVGHVVSSSGGPIRHAQRIYAAYGPALVFAGLAGVIALRGRRRGFVPLVLLMAVGLTLVAVDTLRVMAIVYPVVLLFAAWWLVEVYRVRPALGAALGGAQLAWAWIVCGHMRSFERAPELKWAAMGVSGVALVTCGGAVAMALRARGQRSVPDPALTVRTPIRELTLREPGSRPGRTPESMAPVSLADRQAPSARRDTR